jgi:hypothetical protein
LRGAAAAALLAPCMSTMIAAGEPVFMNASINCCCCFSCYHGLQLSAIYTPFNRRSSLMAVTLFFLPYVRILVSFSW